MTPPEPPKAPAAEVDKEPATDPERCRYCAHWDPGSNRVGSRKCLIAGNITAHNSECGLGKFTPFKP